MTRLMRSVADDSPYHCVMHAVDPDQYTSLPVVFNRTAYSPVRMIMVMKSHAAVSTAYRLL